MIEILKRSTLRNKRRFKTFTSVPYRKIFYYEKKKKYLIKKKRNKTKISYLVRKKQSLTRGFNGTIKPILKLTKLFKKYGIKKKKFLSLISILKKLKNNYISYRKLLLSNCYFLSFKKKKNNFYFTVINQSGEVIYNISSGRFAKNNYNKKRNKKLRSSFFSFSSIIKFICLNLKKKKIRKIRFFIRSRILRKYMVAKIRYRFLVNGVKIMNSKSTLHVSHGLHKKNKKIRRL